LKGKPYVIALEGLPGAGKTSLKNALFEGHILVERIDQILPSDPQDDTILSLGDIVRSDYLKTRQIIASHSEIIILDRYYHSTLAYQYAYDKLRGTQTFMPLKEEYRRALDEGCLVRPDVTFYINVPLEDSYKRKGRQRGDDLWVDPHFLEYTHEYYSDSSEFNFLDGRQGLERIRLSIETYVSDRLLDANS
jgi:thymidylate kinase